MLRDGHNICWEFLGWVCLQGPTKESVEDAIVLNLFVMPTGS